MSIDHLFDTTVENVHMVKVDSYEAAKPPTTKPVSTATEKQLNFLKSLFAERQNNEEAMIVREHLLSEYRAGTLTIRMASDAIEDVKAIPKDTFGPQGKFPVFANHGEVWVTTEGDFVRVKESNSTSNLYGLVWTEPGEWKYTPGIMGKLDHKITVEEASAWGHEFQWCIFCSRPLSDPRSEYAGYGEVCARKHMLPWGELPETDAVINQPTTEKEDVVEYLYGEGSTCRICNQPRPYVLNGFLRGCNC